MDSLKTEKGHKPNLVCFLRNSCVCPIFGNLFTGLEQCACKLVKYCINHCMDKSIENFSPQGKSLNDPKLTKLSKVVMTVPCLWFNVTNPRRPPQNVRPNASHAAEYRPLPGNART